MNQRSRSVLQQLAAIVGGGLVLAALGMSAASITQGHDEAIQLSWDGEQYSSSTSEAFFGTPVVVPGDSVRRTLFVRNTGPSDAILRATITNVELTRDRADGFYDNLLIDWNTGQTTMRQLAANGETTIVDMQLAQGAETEITIGYHFPIDTTQGNRGGGPPRMAGFDVELDLAGASVPGDN